MLFIKNEGQECFKEIFHFSLCSDSMSIIFRIVQKLSTIILINEFY